MSGNLATVALCTIQYNAVGHTHTIQTQIRVTLGHSSFISTNTHYNAMHVHTIHYIRGIGALEGIAQICTCSMSLSYVQAQG